MQKQAEKAEKESNVKLRGADEEKQRELRVLQKEDKHLRYVMSEKDAQLGKCKKNV